MVHVHLPSVPGAHPPPTEGGSGGRIKVSPGSKEDAGGRVAAKIEVGLEWASG